MAEKCNHGQGYLQAFKYFSKRREIRNSLSDTTICTFSIIEFSGRGGKMTTKDKANYTSIAFGSLMETMNLLIISKEVDLIDSTILDKFRTQIAEIARMLTSLRTAQLK